MWSKDLLFYSLNDTLHVQQRNASKEPNEEDGKATLIFYATIYSIIIFLVIVLNSVILISLKPYQRRKRSNVEVLILYLTAFDMTASTMIIVDVYEMITGDLRLGPVGCKLIYPIFQISLNMSICILMIMSIDRCRSINSPTKRKFSKRYIHLAVFISFAVSTIIQTYQFVALHENKKGFCIRNRGLLSFGIPRLVVTISRDVIMLLVILLTSAVIYKAIKNNIVFTMYTKDKREKVMKKIKMLILMELVFAILVIPYDIFDSVMQCVVLLKLDIDFK